MAILGKVGWLLHPVRLRRCTGLRQFVLQILAQQFSVKIVVAICVGVLLPESAGQKVHIPDPLIVMVSAVVLAPILETLLLQTLPIEVGRRRRWPFAFQFLAGSAPFAALHFLGGPAVGLAAGVVGGFFFCYTYMECRKRSWWTATWVTAVTHCLHNLIVLPVFLAMAS